jgi:hypothetical protein
MSAPTIARSEALGGWLPHVALLAATVLIFVVARAQHVDDDEAWAIATDDAASSSARIEAVHRLACRATTRSVALGDQLTRQLLASPDERLREFALTSVLCRHHTGDPMFEPPLQAAYVLQHPGPPATPHHLRSVLHYRRKVGGAPVGGHGRLSWTEVGWFLDSLAGRPMPSAAELEAHLRARLNEGEEVQRSRSPEPPR